MSFQKHLVKEEKATKSYICLLMYFIFYSVQFEYNTFFLTAAVLRG